MIADDVYEIIMNADRINSEIVYDRDFDYDYFGYKTLERSYLLRVNGVSWRARAWTCVCACRWGSLSVCVCVCVCVC